MMNEEKISITEVAKRYPNLTISLTYTELVEAFRDILIEENLKNKLLSEENKTDVLLTEEQVQKMLEVSHSTLWRWQNQDYLTPVSIGRKKRYKTSDVQRILNNK